MIISDVILLLLITGLTPWASACSNFFMDNDPYRISVRTMDLGLGSFDMVVKAAQSPERYGRVGFVAGLPHLPLVKFQTGGLNEVGLSCDQQTLINASYPTSAEGAHVVVSTDSFCGEILANYSSSRELGEALRNGSLAVVAGAVKHTHFVARDSQGESLVVEGLDGIVRARLDLNDDGATGFGILTNEPPLDIHLANVRLLKWKRTLAGSAVTLPGTWYPDDRFARIYLVKQAMAAPTSYLNAVQQAIHVLNTITVPMGDSQLGTDSSQDEGRDHTLYGVVYDHLNSRLYWRTQSNQNFQLLDLNAALGSAAAADAALVMPVFNDDLPWYHDATPALRLAR